MASPFLTYAGLLERSTHLVHVYVPNDPVVVGYQFWGHVTLDDAYGNPVGSGVGGAGPVLFGDVARGNFFRSATLRRKGLAAIPESRKGTTQFAFDPDDIPAVGVFGSTLPVEEQWLFLRTQENRSGPGLLNFAGVPADPVLGPIYMIPPMVTMSPPAPSFTVQATAPAGTGCVGGDVPVFDEDLTVAGPRSMYVVFPYPLREFTVRNLGVTDLLMSFGPGQIMMTLPVGGETQLFSGGTKEMVFADTGSGGCTFGLHGVLTRG